MFRRNDVVVVETNNGRRGRHNETDVVVVNNNGRNRHHTDVVVVEQRGPNPLEMAALGVAVGKFYLILQQWFCLDIVELDNDDERSCGFS